MGNSNYVDRRYYIEDYDPEWPLRFERDARIFKEIFGSDAIAIEHIGSTAIPGMAGKPTIDMLITVNNIECVEKHIAAIEGMGYESLKGYVIPESYLFRKLEDNTLLLNVHVFQKDHPHVKEMLSLRDYLRAHPEVVAEYSTIKRNLFKKYPNDYAQYRKHKDQYMDELKKRIGISK